MAEEYSKGTFSLWYRSSGFKEGLIVTADFIDPLYQEQKGLLLREQGNGLYCLEFAFQIYGTYVALFYENGVKRTTQNFLIKPSLNFNLGSGNLLNRFG